MTAKSDGSGEQAVGSVSFECSECAHELTRILGAFTCPECGHVPPQGAD